MRDAPPSRWHAEGCTEALEAAEALARGLERPGAVAPTGWTVVKDRPMRVVLRSTRPGPEGPQEVVAKVRRAARAADRARNRLRGPRGPLEGSLLRDLAEAGVAVPQVLGWSADPAAGVDVLLLRRVPNARDLDEVAREPATHARARALVEDVARLLRRAHDAGWYDADLHRGNLLVGPAGVTLLDPGTSPLRGPLPAPRRVHALGLAAHGLNATPRQGLAALRAYHDGDRDTARRWLPLVASAARSAARAYRRRRSRRARRTGRHFEVSRLEGGVRVVRNADRAPAAWARVAPDWLARDPEGARALKAGGRVLAARLAGLDETVVVKRFDATWRDRLRTPRAIRGFRRAYGLRVRGVAAPEPLLAASDASGRGILVTAFAGRSPEAIDLARLAERIRAGRAPMDLDDRAVRDRALHRLGRFLRHLHDAEVAHRDLKAPNLVAWSGPRGIAFGVVDLEGARTLDRPVPWRRRARDLARLDASLSPTDASRTDRLRVLRGYWAGFARPPVALAAFARRVAAASARKRGPTGAPR